MFGLLLIISIIKEKFSLPLSLPSGDENPSSKGNVTTIPNEEELVRKAKSYKKRIKRKILVVPLILVGAALILFVGQFVMILTLGVGFTVFSQSYETTDIDEYGVYESHIDHEDVKDRSKLVFFPLEIDDSESVNQFYYYCSTAGLNNAYYIVLDYNLSEEDFYRELDHFERISVEYDGQIKVPKFFIGYVWFRGCFYAF